MPERDPGGGGDPTFHQITDSQINNYLGSQQREINSNKERLNDVEGERLASKNEEDVEEQDDGPELIEVVENVADESAGVDEVKKEAEETESLQKEDEEGKNCSCLRISFDENWKCMCVPSILLFSTTC